jgi:hypothetical protein
VGNICADGGAAANLHRTSSLYPCSVLSRDRMSEDNRVGPSGRPARWGAGILTAHLAARRWPNAAEESRGAR